MAITRSEPFQEIEPWESFSWEPMREIEHMQRRMNRLIERLMPEGNGGLPMLNFMPSAEIEEMADEVHLKVEIPGLEAKDLNIEVTEDAVAISGERKSETKTEEKGIVRSEFRYGKFQRRIPLPTHVQNDKAKAEYKNGILTLTLPKSEKDKKKVTKVKVG
jgi:HSP20 family protein